MARNLVKSKRFLTSGELEEWSRGAEESFWAADCEVVETSATVNVIVDLPACGARDLQLAFLPHALIVQKKVRLLASRNWKDILRALFGPRALFRRFDLPALIDVNRVKADLELGVLTVIAPKQAATEQPAKGVPDRPHAFAA